MQEPSESAVPEPGREPAAENALGYTICINCYEDGTHDVVAGPLQPMDEAQYPDGLFGLESLEDALKAVIALKRSGPDYRSAEEDAMMRVYDGKTNQAITQGY